MKRLLTIQDISCVGQCSTTVALPLVSACGVECAVLPPAILSNHTGGFKSWTFADLTGELPKVEAKWIEHGIRFDAFYTGYVCESHIDPILSIFKTCAEKGAIRVVDPAMADGGKLYPAFDDEYVKAMVKLCSVADYIIPNITEACFLTGIEYKTEYDREYIFSLLYALKKTGAKNVILTGVSFKPETTGIMVLEDGKCQYYEHEFLKNSCHGTGDIYASALVGAMVRGYGAYDAAKIAADFTVDAIRETAGDASHWYGAKFEPVLGNYIAYLKEGEA